MRPIRWVVAPTAVHASHAINQGSNSTGSICCGFVANLFVKNVDNKSSQWSLSLNMHVCAKSRQLSVCVAKCCQYRQMLSPGEYTWCPALSLCAAWCGRLGMRPRRAVHRHYQILLVISMRIQYWSLVLLPTAAAAAWSCLASLSQLHISLAMFQEV